jgi:hypothetical protein
MLSGKIGSEAITLAILDHPKNRPTDLLARARLRPFAANPFGAKAYTDGKGDELRAGARAVGDAQAPRAHPLRPTTADQLGAQYMRYTDEVK